MKKVKGIKNWYYLAGGVFLAAVLCLDVIGGMNYPGYDWWLQGFSDLLAQDSYDVILCTVFVVIAACLAVISVWLIIKFMKANPAMNRLFVNGVRIVLVTVVVFMLILTVVRIPNAGSINYLNSQNAELKTMVEERDDLQVTLDEAIANGSSSNSDSEASQAVQADSATTTESSEVTTARTNVENKDSEIQTKIESIQEIVLEPFMCVHIIGSVFCWVLALFGLIFAAIGGMRKRHGGFRTMAIVAIVAGVGVLAPFVYGIVAHIPFTVFTFADWYGIIYRVIVYSLVGFTAFYTSWIYAYEPPVKSSK